QAAPQEYQHVPIDIQTGKLLEWLQDRRHCGRRWRAQLQRVRERIQAALGDMPEHPEIRELLRGSYLHYFHCLRIVEILRGTEASSKNLFGRYSSQRMKLASLLWRGVSYEAPALRRQLCRGQQAQQELARREDEAQSGAGELRERFRDCCRQYGITGQDVRRELLEQVQALPSLLSRIGDGASALGDAIELYQACVDFVCDSPSSPKQPQLPKKSPRQLLVPPNPWYLGMLRCPHIPRLPPQIDWGDFPAEPPQGGDIDWGITVEPSAQGDDGIDWGDGEEGQEGTIAVLEAGTEAPEDVARGSDALTLLENTETRNQFIDELMELELFLAQRLLELEDEADVVAMSQLQLAPALLQGQSGPRLRQQLQTARELLGQLCSRSLQHLCMIQASPRYVERVSALLRQKLLQAELLLAKREALARRRREARAEQAALEPKLQRLQENMRELQRLIEADISKRYGGRPVNLMGINV
ncbi:CK5P3 protein, partial [Erythrocercus mccallii]|nr:CK5P3 protein [Erythrocercus mccallii]